jgi:putative transposase
MGQSLTITALSKGLEKGRPEIHHSDEGVQYAANEYVQLLQEHDVKISMAEVGQAIALGAFKKGRTGMQSD